MLFCRVQTTIGENTLDEQHTINNPNNVVPLSEDQSSPMDQDKADEYQANDDSSFIESSSFVESDDNVFQKQQTYPHAEPCCEHSKQNPNDETANAKSLAPGEEEDECTSDMMEEIIKSFQSNSNDNEQAPYQPRINFEEEDEDLKRPLYPGSNLTFYAAMTSFVLPDLFHLTHL